MPSRGSLVLDVNSVKWLVGRYPMENRAVRVGLDAFSVHNRALWLRTFAE
jgi:hypothetical protein